MPFRDRLRRAFRSNSSSSSTKSSTKSSVPSTTQPEPRWPSNVYRPDEPMPRLKYRAPVKKEHKEKLEAFDFSSAWRRRSHVSTYSPMGSRLGSLDGGRRKSSHRPSTSRSNSVIGHDKPPRSSQRHNDDQTIGGLSRISSDETADDEYDVRGPHDLGKVYSCTANQHKFDSASALQETASPRKQDSGPPSQLMLDFVKDPRGQAMWSEADLVAALQRNRVVA